MASWDALFAAHGKQLGEYEVAAAERVIGCPCGTRFAPEESEPCAACGSPLCPRCDRRALLERGRRVCRRCRDGQLHCDRCTATVGIVGGVWPEGWATGATITLCPRCLGDEGRL